MWACWFSFMYLLLKARKRFPMHTLSVIKCQRLFFCCIFFPASLISYFFFYLVLAGVTHTKVFYFVLDVMIRKTRKDSQCWSRSTRIVQSHLKKHAHLTNCIHLKHQAHMQKPRMMMEVGHPEELALMREQLTTLQRSRSLRDPSMSPWKSPSAVFCMRNLDTRHAEKDESWEQMTGDYWPKKTSRRIVSGTSKLIVDTSRKSDVSINTALGGHFVDRRNLSEGEDWVEIRPGENSQMAVPRSATVSHTKTLARDRGKYSSLHHLNQSVNSDGGIRLIPELREGLKSGRDLRHGKRQQGIGNCNSISRSARKDLVRGYDKQRNEVSSSRDGTGSLESQSDKSTFGSDSFSQSRFSSRSKKRKIQKSRKTWLQPLSGGGIDLGVASTSRKQRGKKISAVLSERTPTTTGGNGELDLMELTQNGCRIPWNWSRIHSRGKDFLDMAGRSFSCGSSDPGTRRVRTTNFPTYSSSCGESVAATVSETLDTSFASDSESLPLLVEAGSPLGGGSSGFDKNLQNGRLKNELSRRSSRFSQGTGCNWNVDRQCTLSQKYMPKSFHEIVGQNLVTQALSNALLRGKITPVYIFHGPRGTGKSSCARVLAAALNCLSSESHRPCGSCSECTTQSFGKASAMQEVNATGKHGMKVIKALMHDMPWSSSSRYKVFIVNEFHSFSVQAWNTFLKILEKVTGNTVFILLSTSLEQLPHAVVSKCQKFLFSKIKESEIVNRLQHISALESLDVDNEALKLIASTSDGSLRDAEMMLDQLSLLGQKISLPVVQELVGLIPDDKLVDLLDFALSADTVNTVRSLREILDFGAEPLALISQLASLITCILAGSYQLPKERHKRKFLCKNDLTKEEMERIRQALRTLSEAEKQLRWSSDRTTWLTAALLQFAPDQSYLIASSSAGSSVTQSPATLKDVSEMGLFDSSMQKQSSITDAQIKPQRRYARLSGPQKTVSIEDSASKLSGIVKEPLSEAMTGPCPDSSQSSHHLRNYQAVAESSHILSPSRHVHGHCEACLIPTHLRLGSELEDIWQRVLDAVHSNSLRKFLQIHGRLVSLSTAKAAVVAHLEFSLFEHQSRAERSKKSIEHAFQVTLGNLVELKVTLVEQGDQQNRNSISGEQHGILSNIQKSPIISSDVRNEADKAIGESLPYGQSGARTKGLQQGILESVEAYNVKSSATTQRNNQSFDSVILEGGKNQIKHDNVQSPTNEKLETAWVQEVSSPHQSARGTYRPDKHSDPSIVRSNSIGKGKVSLGFVIQHAEGSLDVHDRELQFDQLNGALHGKHGTQRVKEFFPAGVYREGNLAVSAKLEEENLRLESRTGGLLCWKTAKRGQGKVKNQWQTSGRPGLLLKLVPCAKSSRT